MTIILQFSAAPRLFLCIQKQPVFITSLHKLESCFCFLSFHGLSHLIQTHQIWSLASNGEFERALCLPCEAFRPLLESAVEDVSTACHMYRCDFPITLPKIPDIFSLSAMSGALIWLMRQRSWTSGEDTHRILPFVLRPEGPLSQGKAQWVAKWCL